MQNARAWREVTHRIETAEAMEDLGARLGAKLQGGCVIFLSGDLGAGKTTLVRGLLRSLGHDDIVTSPTFTLLEVYDVAGQQIVHVDLYRLDDASELEQLAIRDYVHEQSVLLIEWADRARGALPVPDCEIHIAIDRNTDRTVRIETFTEAGERLCAV